MMAEEQARECDTMVPRDDFDKVLEHHSKWNELLKQALYNESNDCKVDVGCRKISCEFGIWLQSLKANDPTEFKVYGQLVKLHEAYHKALETTIDLYENNSREQARQYFEGDFEEKSLKLTAELLKCIARLNQEELERYETL